MPATPIQSARILPLPPSLSWGQAVQPGSTLTTVNVVAPVDVTSYARRDFELAYRDVVIAAAAASVALKISDVFGFRPPVPVLPGEPTSNFYANLQDVSASVDGQVDHVAPSSVPIEAVQSDRDLYQRDVDLYESLARAAALLTHPPVTSVAPSVVLTDAWSRAESKSPPAPGVVSVNPSLTYGVDLFKLPDQALADRDNTLAASISELAAELADIYARATRLLVQVTDIAGAREAEVYTLTSDDGHYRIFTAKPSLPGRMNVTYDHRTRRVSWRGETYEDSGSQGYGGYLTLNLGYDTLTVVPDLPGYLDSEFYRQKTARLHMTSYVITPVYTQPQLSLDVDPNSISGAVLVEFGTILLTGTGAKFNLIPHVSPPLLHQNYRMSFLALSVNGARLYGALNLSGFAAVNTTAAVLPVTSTMAWALSLTPGRYAVSFTYADLTGPTPAFNVRLRWNGALIFEGTLAYGLTGGVEISSNPVILTSTGGIGSFTLERFDTGTGSLLVDTVSFTDLNTSRLDYTLTCAVGTEAYTVAMSAQPNRWGVFSFDLPLCTPTALTLTLSGLSHGGLYLQSYDLRTYRLQVETPNTTGFRQWKRAFIKLALESIRRAWRTFGVGHEASVLINGNEWTVASTTAWIGLLGVTETRINMSTRLSQASDVGQPALTPPGLSYNQTTGLSTVSNVSDLNPTIQALQPWMIPLGIRVLVEDFHINYYNSNFPFVAPPPIPIFILDTAGISSFLTALAAIG